MKKNVIFLDVDGVLDSVESEFRLDDKCFDNLKTLIDWFDADIILSSSWRKIPEDVETINNKLKEKTGITLSGKTGVHESGCRGKEILDFLGEHPEIEDYIVIDDDSYDITPYIKRGKFIHTKSMVGLTDLDVRGFIMYREEYNKKKEQYIRKNI